MSDVKRHASDRGMLQVRRTVKKLRPARPLIIRDNSTVSEACRRMASAHSDAVLLTGPDSVLCGIFTDKDLVTRVIARGLKPDETPVSAVMTRSPIFVANESLVDDALQKMLQGKFRHLPVIDDGQVVSVLSITKFLYDAIVQLESEADKCTSFRELLSRAATSTSIEGLRGQVFQPTLGSLIMQAFKAMTLSQNDTVAAATRKMLEANSDYVIVMDGDVARGIFTSNDLLMRVVAKHMSPDSTAIRRVMTTNIESASLHTTIVDALHIMHDGRFCHLPIVGEDGNIIGCIGILELMEGSLVCAADWVSTARISGSALEDDDYSEVSAKLTPECVQEAKTAYPSLWLSNLFSFKIEDPRGCVHRFNCGTHSLDDLASAIVSRIGNEKACLQILYKDDEGDLVLISSDHDLALAVSFAKAFGTKVLRLYIDCPNKSGGDGKSHGNWRTTLQTTTVIASILMIVGLGILFHARRSGEEPWKDVFNRFLRLDGEGQGV